MNKLNVFFEHELVGKLIRDEELTYSFSYDSNWLKSPNKFQLSLALPLREEPYGNRLTLSFFENLLPEGDVREILERNNNITGPFEFLKEFGKDCAGAIIVSEQEVSPFEAIKKREIEIDVEKIYKAIEKKYSVADVIAQMKPGYLSLAGAQDKFPAIYRNKKIFLPTHSAPTTHIIKIPIWRMEVMESVYNEYYCMKLAKAVGLNVPECHILDEGRHPLFIVERYDRDISKEGIVHRIHQQDFCQALGIVSEQKYEAKGGPSLKDNYDLITKNVWVKKRTKNIYDFFDWILNKRC